MFFSLIGICHETLAQTSSDGYGRPGYTYVGGGIAMHELDDGGGCSQDGIYLEGSLGLDGQLFVQGQHVDVTSNSWCGSTTTTLSAGLRNDYGNHATMYVIGSVLNRDYGPDSDAGLGFAAGVRAMISRGVEAGGALSYETLDGSDQLYLTGSLNYWLSKDFSAKAELSTADNGNFGFGLGIRYNF